ncbi:sigma-70 family RNA polymerase sigma factor, partial [Patulibacter brassicae]
MPEPGRRRRPPRRGRAHGASFDPGAALDRHLPMMLREARRWSICEDDAHDAVQAAAERFLHRHERVDPVTVGGWLRTVARNEALRVRDRRVRHVVELDLDGPGVASDGDGPEDRAARDEELAIAREALLGLKPAERQALWLQAQGLSYEEIADQLGWTRTKVNRNVAEGRARLRKSFRGLVGGEACAAAGPRIERLAAGEASGDDLRLLRPHVRRCPSCRARLRRARGGPLALVPAWLLALLPWAGRAGGTPAGGRGRVAELVAERVTGLLPGVSGAATEVGLAVAGVAATAAIGAGVVAGSSAGPEPAPRPATVARAPTGAPAPSFVGAAAGGSARAA